MKIGKLAVLHVGKRVAGQAEQRFCGVVAFGMNGGIVEHTFALRHAQEARALLERLGTELRHFFDLRTRGKRAVFLTVGNDIFRRRSV